MGFLIDNSISPVVADGLRQAGHDAVHVRDYGLEEAADDDIIDRALAEDRIAIAYDLDFPRLLALRRQAKPSLIIFRRLRHPADQAPAILRSLAVVGADLERGCIVTFEPDRVRVRDLPLSKRARTDDA